MSKISVVFHEISNGIEIETEKIVIDSSVEEDKDIKVVTEDFFG